MTTAITTTPYITRPHEPPAVVESRRAAARSDYPSARELGWIHGLSLTAAGAGYALESGGSPRDWRLIVYVHHQYIVADTSRRVRPPFLTLDYEAGWTLSGVVEAAVAAVEKAKGGRA